MEFLEGGSGETSLHKEVSPVFYFFESALVYCVTPGADEKHLGSVTRSRDGLLQRALMEYFSRFNKTSLWRLYG